MSLTDDMIEVAMHVADIEAKSFSSQIYPGSKAMEPHFDSEDDELEKLIVQFNKRKTKKLMQEIGFRTQGHIYSKAVRVLEMLNN